MSNLQYDRLFMDPQQKTVNSESVNENNNVIFYNNEYLLSSPNLTMNQGSEGGPNQNEVQFDTQCDIYAKPIVGEWVRCTIERKIYSKKPVLEVSYSDKGEKRIMYAVKNGNSYYIGTSHIDLELGGKNNNKKDYVAKIKKSLFKSEFLVKEINDKGEKYIVARIDYVRLIIITL